MNAIVCNDVYEARIREFRAAIELMEAERDGASDADDPFCFAKELLWGKMWECFDQMCANKKMLSDTEWRNLLEDMNKRESPSPMTKWDPYFKLKRD